MTALCRLHTLNLSRCPQISNPACLLISQLSGLTNLVLSHCNALSDPGLASLGGIKGNHIIQFKKN